MVHSLTVGETTVFSSSVVNSLRFAVNKAKVDNYQTPFFSPEGHRREHLQLPARVT